MSGKRKDLSTPSSAGEVEAFLRKVAATPPATHLGRRGRLLFGMDATASREPTWDQACQLQAEMFDATAELGGLDVQLAWYRGFREFHHTPWLSDARALARRMTRVRCAGGMTQIERLLQHALAQARDQRVDALVFVGDCMEEEVDRLCGVAGELGLIGVPAFLFHEGDDAVAERAFREICRLSRGAYCRFDAGSAEQLRQLLTAVAVFAAGGRRALDQLASRQGSMVKQLVHQLD